VTVDCTVRNDDGRLVARLTGRLGLPQVAHLRIDLLKCLAEQPSALLVDLSGMTVAEPLALSVFIAVARQAARWPGTPVVLCAPGAETARLLHSAAYRRLPVHASVEAGRAHLGDGGHGPPTIAEDLLPISGAAREGRNVATDACLRWNLPGLIGPASLICSELISNVVDHARTMMTVRLSLGAKYLFIAVRDGSPVEPVSTVAPPVADRGRGLHLVASTAHLWGSLPTTDGKVVWASLTL
jgi:hypothetical protein